jgi:hypothetical protein
MRAALGAVLALVTAVILGCGGSHPRVVKGAPPPPSRAELRTLARLALRAAGGAGDPHPTGAVVVPSTRKIAERVDAGAVVDSNPPVYFVLLHGHFTANMAPPGGKFPQGTILTVTIDSRTNESLDLGIGKRLPDLAAIGEAEPLALPHVDPVRAAIRVARASDPRLFAIFPRSPGERPCGLPAGGMTQQVLVGECRTGVTHPVTHGRHDELFVTFAERWGRARRHHSSWTLIVQLPADRVVATQLHGETAPQLRYAPPLRTDLELTRHVPCVHDLRHRAGPKALRRFHAVTAVSCVEGTRTYPGRGQWEVLIRRVAVGSVAGLQRYFEQPSRHGIPKGVVCSGVLHVVVVPTLVDGLGHRLVPRTPLDGCGNPLGAGPPSVRWQLVSVRKVKLLVSPAALAAHCAMEIKDLPGGGIGRLDPSRGGPVFRSPPKTLKVCIYRTHDFQVGDFVRGFRLDAAKTRELLRALTGAAPRGSCPAERTFAVVGARQFWAEVELGGCWRVGRTYPDYAIGSADPSVAAPLLGVR